MDRSLKPARQGSYDRIATPDRTEKHGPSQSHISNTHAGNTSSPDAKGDHIARSFLVEVVEDYTTPLMDMSVLSDSSYALNGASDIFSTGAEDGDMLVDSSEERNLLTPTTASSKAVPSKDAPPARQSSEGETARDHPLYKNAAPQADGLFHCPWEGQPSCSHRPDKLKCNYDKFVDSHLKPYRCKVENCENTRFSSTACLLRHEREAHGLHGLGDRPYLCTYEGCDRAIAGNGFPRQWNLRDHFKRVHHSDPQPSLKNHSGMARKREVQESATQPADMDVVANSLEPAKVIAGSLEEAPLAALRSVPKDHFVDTEQLTDSGYASIQRDSISRVNDASSPINTNDRPVSSTQADVPDDATVYSVAWSVPDDVLDTYKSELAESLFKQLRQFLPDHGLLQSSSSPLTAFLRSFALRLGGPGSSKAAKEVMYFIHKNRGDIASRFEAAARCAQEEDLAIYSAAKKDVLAKLDIGKWLQTVEDGMVLEPAHHVDDDDKKGHGREWDDDDIDEQPALPDKRGYRDVVFGSASYRWLLASMVKTLTLALPDKNDDVCAEIHTRIKLCVEQNHSVSSRRPSQRFRLLFRSDWNPLEFLRDKFPDDLDVGRLLRESLTLTGTLTNAQALPCAEYLRQTWPATGPQVLSLLTRALNLGTRITEEMSDTSIIMCHFTSSQLFVRIEGTIDTIAEIGEQIAWLGAALRPSCSDSGVTTCRPVLEIPKPGITSMISLRYALETGSTGTKGPEAGQCWHELFRSPVVVTGYPIPRRTQDSKGLEIPLQIMSRLTDCPRVNEYLGGYFLKGFSTALVPTAKSHDITQWHMFYTSDGSRLPYWDAHARFGVDLNLAELQKSRHIVGWCSKANFLTGSPTMNYQIGATQLPRPGREFCLEKVSFSVGQIVTGGCQFAIGHKEPPVRITHASYSEKLRWLNQRYVTLWDVSDSRGWLVNANAALLHLLRASLESSRTDKFASGFLFEAKNFKESPNPGTLDSVLDVLLNTDNQKLELYLKDRKTYTKTRTFPDGHREEFTETIQSCTTVKDRVEELYESLEKLIDFNASLESSSKGLDAKPRLHDHLFGWDFADIATSRDPFHIKKANLPLQLISWVDFTKAIPAVTLFGKGFGDLIRAAPCTSSSQCSKWETMPVNSNLLCVSAADLGDIIERTGDLSAKPITVAPGIGWNSSPTDELFRGTCSCTSFGTRISQRRRPHHHPIQELKSSKFQWSAGEVDLDLSSHPDGAIIFGRQSERHLAQMHRADSLSAEASSSVTTGLGHSSTSDASNADDQANASLPTPSWSPSGGQGYDSSSTDSREVGGLRRLPEKSPGTIMGEKPAHMTVVQGACLKRKAVVNDAHGSEEAESQDDPGFSRIRKVAKSIERKFRSRGMD